VLLVWVATRSILSWSAAGRHEETIPWVIPKRYCPRQARPFDPASGVVPSTQTEAAESSRRSLLAKAGLLAGGVGAVLLHGSERALAQSVAETMEITPPAGDPALRLLPSGSVPPSVSVGGALNLDNTASTGAGAVLYSNQGAGALGRLLVVNQANPANPQAAVRIQNAGIAHTVSIFHDPAGGAGDPTSEALDVVSTNPLDTTFGVKGQEEAKGTVKITHAKPAGDDADASALSIALHGAGTAAQGIFIGNDSGNPTTGALLNIRNGGPGSERLVLTADGRVDLPVQGPAGGVLIGSDASLYRSAPSVLATDGTVKATVLQGDGVLLDVQATNPPAPIAGEQARLYVRAGKLVIQWNKDGTVLYTVIRLDRGGRTLVTTGESAP
jgi:hyaluronidase-like protein HylP